MSPIPGIIASSQTGGLVTGSFESIATVAGTGSSGTITFSNIPSGYKALQIRYIAKSTQGGTAARYTYTVQFNSDTGSNYSYHFLRGQSSVAQAGGSATQTAISTNSTMIPNSGTGMTNIHAAGIIDIIDYTSTSKAKTLKNIAGLEANGTVAGMILLNSGLWYATPAAITTIAITVNTGSWTTTSSFALYGVK